MEQLRLIELSLFYNIKKILYSGGWGEMTTLLSDTPADFSKIVLPQNFVEGSDEIKTPVVVLSIDTGGIGDFELGNRGILKLGLYIHVFGSTAGERSDLLWYIFNALTLKYGDIYDDTVLTKIEENPFPPVVGPTITGTVDYNGDNNGFFHKDTVRDFLNLTDMYDALMFFNIKLY